MQFLQQMQFLQEQPWHGNVRELESALRRALLVTPGYPITLNDVRRVMIASAGPGRKKRALAFRVGKGKPRARATR